jgi:hypothetical protein
MLTIRNAYTRVRRQQVDGEDCVAVLVGQAGQPKAAIQLSLKAAKLMQAELEQALTWGCLRPEDEAQQTARVAKLRKELNQ